ncbi:carcinoembryonic antigen-related cell adhesion molecule 8-like [Loxodonta africana]|uniref:carcinoembryonic antigen-related cell adhesion molecule 8-like n=1 Tax=Loxodonta africana TaxID=9785 RepID=UPI0030CBCEC0
MLPKEMMFLLPHNPSADPLFCVWYEGESIGNDKIASYIPQAQSNDSGPAYTGRETIYHNGSLLFQNVTLNHSGVYTLQITTILGDSEILAGQICAYFWYLTAELPTPFITSNSCNPVEDQDFVTLRCDPKTQNTTYLWLINNQSLPDSARLEMSSDNRFLTIHSVIRNDTGPYEYRTWNLVNVLHSDPFILNVLCE